MFLESSQFISGWQKTSMHQVRFIDGSTVREVIDMASCVDAVRSGYRQRGAGAPANPRTTLEENLGGKYTGYLAALPDAGVMGGYVYSAGFESNDAYFLLLLFDIDSGAPVAIIDGAYLNPFKTGSAGAVGVDVLARSDATTVAVIGSGTQARAQLRATAVVRDLETVRIYSPTAANRNAFAQEFDQYLDATVEAVATSNTAVRGADIIITATRATEPVVDDTAVDPGTHITAMGQYSPDRRELETATVARSVYVPDLRSRAHQDAGSFLAAVANDGIDAEHIHAELGEVIAGQAPGRESTDQVTIFDSGGTGIETVAVGALVNKRAAETSTVSVEAASEAFSGR